MAFNWDNLIKSNANSFAIGNLNQFQVSPFAPSNTSDTTGLSTLLSTCCGQISSIINLTTYTLSISTIVPIAPSLDPSQTITMNATALQYNANTMNLNIGTVLAISTPLITFSTLVGSTITSNILSCSTLLNISTISTNNAGPLTIGSNVTIAGCAQFRGCVSTISTNLVLDSNVWGKYLFVNKAEQLLTLSVNTLASEGTYMVIKNVASTAGRNITVNVTPYGDFSTYTISSFSTLRLMSMPSGWYSI
jgi:hypothetical protein